MNLSVLKATAQAMVAPGKGILAIDESHSTCAKRFEKLGVPCTEETRRAYRGLLVGAPGIGEFVSGMILFDETLRQATDAGVPFAEVLKQGGMIPGIKVDTGAKDLALHPGEMVTEGLDGLRERLKEYASLGAGFAKWRAVITIGAGLPSEACIEANAHALARYAALCQEADIVPMVEPEILMEGSHSIEECYEATARTLRALFAQLKGQGVALEGTILKVSMVISGTEAAWQASPQEVAEQTLKCLKENVPSELPGIVFLSGGQSPEQSTLHLNLINQLGDKPWPISFSYGRGIQAPALELWAKDPAANVSAAQERLVYWSKMNSQAARGLYTPEA